MASIKKVFDGDTVRLDDNRDVRMMGIDTPESAIQDASRLNKVGGWASSYYLKRWIGSATGTTVTVSQNSYPIGSGKNDTDLYGRYLRKLDVSSTVIEETLLSEGLASLYNFRGTLSKLDNSTALEAAAVAGAEKVLFHPSHTDAYDRNLPPRKAYDPIRSYYRRIYVDMADGGDTENNAILTDLFTAGRKDTENDTQYTWAYVQTNFASISTGAAWGVPDPDNPVCETLVVLTGSPDLLTEFRWGPDDADMTNQVPGTITWAGLINDTPMGGNPLSVGERIFAGRSIQFITGSSDYDKILTWLNTFDIEGYDEHIYGNPAQDIVAAAVADRDSEYIGPDVLPVEPDDSPRDIKDFASWVPQKKIIASRPDDRLYYSGVDCQIFVNDEYLDEASYLTHTIDISRKPFHAVNAVYPRFFSGGKQYISGVLRFPLVQPEMIRRMVERLVTRGASSPRELIRTRERYKSGLLNNGLNEAITLMREFYSHRIGRPSENVGSSSPGFLNGVSAEHIKILVGAADVVVATDQPLYFLTYHDVDFVDFSTGVNADSRLVECQVSFIASRYTEELYGDDEVDQDFEAVAPGFIEVAGGLDESTVGIEAGSLMSTVSSPAYDPLPLGNTDELELAAASDVVPTPDDSQAQAAIDEPDTVEDSITDEAFVNIVRVFPNNSKWYLDKTDLTNLLADFATWIHPTTSPLSLIFQEADFDTLRVSSGGSNVPSDDLVLLYCCYLGLVYAETLPGSKFDLEAVGIDLDAWDNSYVAIFDALNDLSSPMDDAIDHVAGTSQGLINRTVRDLRSTLNGYGYAFPETTADSPYSGAGRTAALAQFKGDINARGPTQTLGTYYMLEHAEYDRYFQFYRTYVTDVDKKWFEDVAVSPGITNGDLYENSAALQSVMTMNFANFLNNYRKAGNTGGRQDLVNYGSASASIVIDHGFLAATPMWHRWGPGYMAGYATTDSGGRKFGPLAMKAYNANKDYFKMMWSVAMDIYRETVKYNDSGVVDAGGTTLKDRITAAITT